MNLISRPARRRAAVAAAGIACFLFLASGVRAQAPISGEGTETGIRPRDYFTREIDHQTAELVDVVQRYHLSDDNYYKKYREGLFPAARQDLLYVLRLIPNHPRALNLIAYDPNVGLKSADVIWYFERAIRMFPNSAFTYAQYGRYMVRHGATRVGIELLDDALRLDPKLLDARAWLAEASEADTSRTVR